MSALFYTPPQLRVVFVSAPCQVLNESGNRNRVSVDYDDTEIELS